MFRRSMNRAVIRLRIDTVAPLLIKAGDPGLDPTVADLSCVRTHHAGYGMPTVYIPGSSLKGVMRSAIESSLRGRKWSGVERGGACNPLDWSESCGTKVRPGDERRADSGMRRIDTAAVHKDHCLACRLFGSTTLKGRAAIRDLFPWSRATATLTDEQRAFAERANKTEMRHGVAINRLTGSVQHGPFEQEMVPSGVSFWGDIALENYQVWQLGVLAQAMDEINDGFAQLGSAKSRGLGVAKVAVEELTHEQPQGEARPMGVGKLLDGAEAQRYGLLPESDLPQATGVSHGLVQRFEVDADAARRWLDAGLAALTRMEVVR